MLFSFDIFVWWIWALFIFFNSAILLLCIIWDGFWTFVTGELGEAITIIVCFAFFMQIMIDLAKMSGL